MMTSIGNEQSALRIVGRARLVCSLSVLAAMGWTPQVRGFDILVHKSMTVSVLEAYRYTTTANKTIDGFETAEKIGNYNRGTDFGEDAKSPTTHCDDNRVKLCAERVASYQRDIVLKLSSDPQRHAESAREDLGRALHTIQDFYAHSTWVETHAAIVKPTLSGVVLAPAPNCTDGSTPLPGITTGFYAKPNARAHEELERLIAEGNCVHGQYITDHRNPLAPLIFIKGIAKDFNGPFRNKALNLAAEATEQFVDEIRDALPFEKRDAAMCALMGVTDPSCNPRILTIFSSDGYPRSPVPLLYTATSTTTSETGSHTTTSSDPNFRPGLLFWDSNRRVTPYSLCRDGDEFVPTSFSAVRNQDDPPFRVECTGQPLHETYTSSVTQSAGGILTARFVLQGHMHFTCDDSFGSVVNINSTDSTYETVDTMAINLDTGRGSYSRSHTHATKYTSRSTQPDGSIRVSTTTGNSTGTANGGWDASDPATPLAGTNITISTQALPEDAPLPQRCYGPALP